MKTFVIIFMILSLYSCSTITIPGPSPVITENTCYVNWRRPEYKAAYEKIQRVPRSEMEKNGELIPLNQNGGIFVRSKLKDKKYSIIFDYSDPNSNRFVDRIMDEYINEIHPQMRNALKTVTFKASEQDLKEILVGYEPVDCATYMAAQVTPQLVK